MNSKFLIFNFMNALDKYSAPTFDTKLLLKFNLFMN